MHRPVINIIKSCICRYFFEIRCFSWSFRCSTLFHETWRRLTWFSNRFCIFKKWRRNIHCKFDKEHSLLFSRKWPVSFRQLHWIEIFNHIATMHLQQMRQESNKRFACTTCGSCGLICRGLGTYWKDQHLPLQNYKIYYFRSGYGDHFPGRFWPTFNLIYWFNTDVVWNQLDCFIVKLSHNHNAGIQIHGTIIGTAILLF